MHECNNSIKRTLFAQTYCKFEKKLFQSKTGTNKQAFELLFICLSRVCIHIIRKYTMTVYEKIMILWFVSPHLNYFDHVIQSVSASA